jgi:archaellum biogenesis protein FlaJ (TadC family)
MKSSYLLLKPIVDRLHWLNKAVQRNLDRAYMNIHSKDYVASMILYSSIVSMILAFTLILGSTVGMEPLRSLSSILIGVVADPLSSIGLKPVAAYTLALIIWMVIASTIAFTILYLYPVYVSSEASRRLESDLIYTLGYMSILYTAGIPVERIFSSLAMVGDAYNVRSSALNIVKSVEFLGWDILDALNEEADRTRSRAYQAFLRGMSTVVKSGGDLKNYMIGFSERVFSKYRDSIEDLTEALDFLSEFYLTLFIVMPIVIVVVAVLIGLAGGYIGPLTARQLVDITIYVVVPFASLAFILIIDVVASRWKL